MGYNKISLQLFFVIGFTSALGTNYCSTKMKSFKVLVTNPTVPEIGIKLLTDQGCEVIQVTQENREEIIKHAKGVDALFWASCLSLDKEVLDVAGPQMKAIGIMSAGYDHIDVEEAKKRGIKLGNTPHPLHDAVADLAVLLLLAAARRAHEARLLIENNKWITGNWKWMLGQDVTNSTVGVIGLGNIGLSIVKRLQGFNVKQFLYTGHKEKKEAREIGAKFVSLNTLLEESDFVIIVVPLTAETKGMCDDDFFSKMKKTAVFVNVSRGPVVDQPALIRALKNGQIFAAGLDVMTPEPLPADHELTTLPNVVLLPHLGSATNNTRASMSSLTAENILKALGDEEMITPI
ncbi:glyoxylate reductase/hydroxypyruvate reductase-like isoform X2 [Diorhabda sublineata]|uniref:glyoxylate reductase/hydroxypyruvate reductase-like isoform X2 n=1 Tax=Diorhabda sublineata TaxID=1163346 RepID=UPI0024E130E4|nr:glyoxylate reductase/hydroxypyruvate reductase-like isoform X2 [Diorhabda sublineata]